MLAGLTSRWQHSVFMREVKRIRYRDDDFDDEPFGHARWIAFPDEAGGIGAVHVVHRDPDLSVELAAIVDPHDVWMPQRCC
ncbi:MAG: hypothetical protein QOH54_2536 [Mycobacterium sp.]|nr:hypothetical protein [Mycobacterium sp.]MDT5126892.1 hypothetical protein [Mycobacterium sp.]